MLSVVTGEFRLSAFFKVFFSLSFQYTNDCRKMLKHWNTEFQDVESG